MQSTVDSDRLIALEGLAAGYIPAPIHYVRKVVVLGSAVAYAVRASEDSGAVILASADNTVVSLPLASTCAGQEILVANMAANGTAKVSISPAAADAIVGSLIDVTGVNENHMNAASGVVNKDFINTKATATVGNFVKLLSTGSNWLILEGIGIWVSEA